MRSFCIDSLNPQYIKIMLNDSLDLVSIFYFYYLCPHNKTLDTMKEEEQQTSRMRKVARPKDPDHVDRRGGARPGAGRPRTFSKQIKFTAPKDMADYLEAQPDKTGYIRQCILTDILSQQPAIDLDTLDQPVDTGHALIIPGNAADNEEIAYIDAPVAAGEPIEIDQCQYAEKKSLWKLFKNDKDDLLMMPVEGLSMIEDGIETGDVIVVDRTVKTVHESDIALCGYKGGFTIKHVHRDADGITLLPRNASMKPMKVTEYDDFHVWGKVIGSITFHR